MAENEKCFCHLNGFKVKDADARALIEELNELYIKLQTYVNTLEAKINVSDKEILEINNSKLDKQNNPDNVSVKVYGISKGNGQVLVDARNGISPYALVVRDDKGLFKIGILYLFPNSIK